MIVQILIPSRIATPLDKCRAISRVQHGTLIIVLTTAIVHFASQNRIFTYRLRSKILFYCGIIIKESFFYFSYFSSFFLEKVRIYIELNDRLFFSVWVEVSSWNNRGK